MTSGKRFHLAHRLVFTTRCCKCAFAAQSATIVSYPWEYSPSPAGERPIMASSERTFLAFPPFYLSLPVGLYSGRRALLDSFPNSLFSLALLVGRALQRACPLNFPRSWGTPDALASTCHSQLLLIVPKLFATPCLHLC